LTDFGIRPNDHIDAVVADAQSGRLPDFIFHCSVFNCATPPQDLGGPYMEGVFLAPGDEDLSISEIDVKYAVMKYHSSWTQSQYHLSKVEMPQPCEESSPTDHNDTRGSFEYLKGADLLRVARRHIFVNKAWGVQARKVESEL
jgi:hypothetical protein